MTIKEAGLINNKEQARAFVIDWQTWSNKQSLSYLESSKWLAVFEELADRFNLAEEFRENGII